MVYIENGGFDFEEFTQFFLNFSSQFQVLLGFSFCFQFLAADPAFSKLLFMSVPKLCLHKFGFEDIGLKNFILAELYTIFLKKVLILPYFEICKLVYEQVSAAV